MKIIIAGSRDFIDYSFLKSKMDIILKDIQKDNIEIVCGMCRGADLLGKQYAEENKFGIIEMPANWLLGKKAGFIRNEEMAKVADACVVFIKNNSKGSSHMINLAKKYNLKLRVIEL